MEEQNEQPNRITAEREHEDLRSGVQQHPEATSEPAFGASQYGRNAGDLVWSGRSRGEPRCSAYTIVRHY